MVRNEVTSCFFDVEEASPQMKRCPQLEKVARGFLGEI